MNVDPFFDGSFFFLDTSTPTVISPGILSCRHLYLSSASVVMQNMFQIDEVIYLKPSLPVMAVSEYGQGSADLLFRTVSEHHNMCGFRDLELFSDRGKW